jgi:hypothetical protein
MNFPAQKISLMHPTAKKKSAGSSGRPATNLAPALFFNI